MSNKKGSVCKLCRRSGTKLFLKGERCHTAKCAIEQRNYPPGLRNVKRRLSEYGVRLREKQKLRYFYGVSEKKMQRYFKDAANQKGVTGFNLLQIFERRLDNVIFKSGLTPSRREAHQLVLHKHFALNGRTSNVPSILVKEGDVITINKPDSEFWKQRIGNLSSYAFPAWIDYDSKKQSFTIKNLPTHEEIKSPVDMQLIVEYYSR